MDASLHTQAIDVFTLAVVPHHHLTVRARQSYYYIIGNYTIKFTRYCRRKPKLYYEGLGVVHKDSGVISPL